MKTLSTLIAAGVLLGVVPAAQAHVSFVNNRVPAGASFIATANIPHGCSGSDGVTHDTYQVMIELPGGIKARPMHSPVGRASVDSSGDITKLVWERDPSDVNASDNLFYQVTFRFSVPVGTELTKLQFKTTQLCDGNTQAVWEGAEVPTLYVVPAHTAGWNKFTAQADIPASDFAAFFGDAQIVWYNDQAYSANPTVSALITNPLTTAIPQGATYWVKY
jgi:uncharacterized protein YcnI